GTGGHWRKRPQQQRELAGDMEERFPLQVACDAADAQGVLAASGWQPAPGWTTASVLQALLAPGAGAAVPPLPRLDQGRRAALTFVAPAASGQARQVLRLWRSDVDVVQAAGTRVPVWYGAVYLEQRGHRPLHRPHAENEDAAPLVQQLLAHGARALN